MDGWDEFLLFVYGLPPAVVIGAALAVKLAARLMGKSIGWGKAFGVGVVALVVCFVGLVAHWLLNG